MEKHICTTESYPKYCDKHNLEFYRSTCGCGTGCFWCDFEYAVEAAYKNLPDNLHTRIEKAKDLVMSGKVLKGENVYYVFSQTDDNKYYIVNGQCNCPDAQYRAPKVNGRPACKHQIACWLTIKMKQNRKVGL